MRFSRFFYILAGVMLGGLIRGFHLSQSDFVGLAILTFMASMAAMLLDHNDL